MRKLPILLIAVLSAFAIWGCNTKDEDLSKLTGTWECEKFILDGDDAPLSTFGMTIHITFRKDKTWSGVTTGTDAFELPLLGGTFVLDGKQLTLNNEGGETLTWLITTLEKNYAEFSWPDQTYIENEVSLFFVK